MSFPLVDIDTADGRFQAYAAEPLQPAGAAVLVLPEIYNINGWIRQVAERYAGQGFHVLVPDLYWRQEPGQHLEYTPEHQQRGRELAGALDRELAVRDIAALAAGWRQRLPAGTPVIAVGYCLGGELAFLAAAAGAVDGASGWYATNMARHLAQGERIRVPVQLHFGELDWRTPPELIQSVRAAVAGRPEVELTVHAGADHGFGRFGHPPFHAGAAAAAQVRTLALIDALRAAASEASPGRSAAPTLEESHA